MSGFFSFDASSNIACFTASDIFYHTCPAFRLQDRGLKQIEQYVRMKSDLTGASQELIFEL